MTVGMRMSQPLWNRETPQSIIGTVSSPNKMDMDSDGANPGRAASAYAFTRRQGKFGGQNASGKPLYRFDMK